VGLCVSGGSSPHTRGTHPLVAQADRGWRFIPAYAGNTTPRSRSGRMWSVHPRIRGEHAERRCSGSCHSGSSPHTRGTRSRSRFRVRHRRFIPAYAGNTSPFRADVIKPPVHPRIRGEHMPRRSLGRPIRGSSPHTRGTHP